MIHKDELSTLPFLSLKIQNRYRKRRRSYQV